ncbi:MAG: trigger factor [Chitinophagaceae bacterium]
MPSIQTELLSPNHQKVSIRLQADDYAKDINKSISNYALKANIPGFRQGKVPIGMIKKMYGNSIFEDEVLKVVSRVFENYLVENKINFLARPLPLPHQNNLDLNAMGDLLFEFEYAERPTLDLNFLNQTFEKYQVQISQDELDKEIDYMLTNSGSLNDVEALTSEEYVVEFSLRKVGEDKVLTDKNKQLLLKAFNKQAKTILEGQKKGFEFSLVLQDMFEKDFLDALVNELDVTDTINDLYVLSVINISEIIKAEMNEETYLKIFPNLKIANEEEFVSAVKNDLLNYWEKQATTKFHNDIFEYAVHNTPFEIPQAFFKRWLQIAGEKLKTSEEVEKEYGSFEHGLRWQLISEELSKKYNISISKEEIEDAVRQEIFGYFGGAISLENQDLSWVDNIVEKQMKDENYVSQTVNKIQYVKLFNQIEEVIKINEKSISIEEFVKLPHNHHH